MGKHKNRPDKYAAKKAAKVDESLSPLSCELYAISPARLPDLGAFAAQLEEGLATGDIAVFQLRLKDAAEGQIREAITRLMPLCHARHVPFILNDAVELAAEFGCDGVHLGQEDMERMPIKKARRLLGEQAVIGATCHASIHLAMEAGEQGADYVAFGAFYPTTSKPKEKLERWGTPTPEILTDWSAQATLPCVAIGGITPENALPLVAAGADFVAAITSIWQHPRGTAAAVAEFQTTITQGLAQRS